MMDFVSYLGRAVATAGDAAHRLGLAAAAGRGVTVAAARVVVVFVVAAAEVAARREARMVEGGSRGNGEERSEEEKSERRAWCSAFFVLNRDGGFISSDFCSRLFPSLVRSFSRSFQQRDRGAGKQQKELHRKTVLRGDEYQFEMMGKKVLLPFLSSPSHPSFCCFAAAAVTATACSRLRARS